jgi:glycerophosphoryl diester phosphodiesterase
MSDLLNIAHRGASGYAPENTLAAFDLAVKMGAGMIELDLHQTSDSHLVVCHDFDLKRTAGLRRRVRSLDLLTLRTLDVGSWRHPKFADQRIPTLLEVFDTVPPRVRINIELKKGSPYYPDIESRLVRFLEKQGRMSRVIVSSFDQKALLRLRRLSPSLRIGLLSKSRLLSTLFRAASRLKAASLHLSTRRLKRRWIPAAHQRGLKVYVYTVNDPPLMRRCLEMGADGLFTDYPDRLAAVLRERG